MSIDVNEFNRRFKRDWTIALVLSLVLGAFLGYGTMLLLQHVGNELSGKQVGPSVSLGHDRR